MPAVRTVAGKWQDEEQKISPHFEKTGHLYLTRAIAVHREVINPKQPLVRILAANRRNCSNCRMVVIVNDAWGRGTRDASSNDT